MATPLKSQRRIAEARPMYAELSPNPSTAEAKFRPKATTHTNTTNPTATRDVSSTLEGPDISEHARGGADSERFCEAISEGNIDFGFRPGLAGDRTP
jgi:hypothetical protein